MIFRWKCNKCGKEIETGKTRLKVVQLNPYKHVGDLCKSCWEKIDQKEKEVENDDSKLRWCELRG